MSVSFLGRATHGPRAAVFLTFQFDGPEFIRRLWDPIMSRRGFSRRNCAVLFDAAFPLHVQLSPADIQHGPRLCRVAVKRGCFHPKLAVVVVGKQWFIALGSANLSRGGLGGNLELSQSFDSFESAATIASDVREFLDSLQSKVITAESNNPWADGQIARVAKVLPRPSVHSRGPRLLTSLGSPLVDQMALKLKGQKVRTAAIISPLHIPSEVGENSTAGDRRESGGIVRKLEDQLVIKQQNIQLYTDYGGLAPYRPSGAPGIQILCRQRSKSEDGDDLRPLHAKAYQFRANGGWEVFWGSANLTESALGKTAGNGGNVELLVHEVIRGRSLPIKPNKFKVVDSFSSADQGKREFSSGPVILSAIFSRKRNLLEIEWTSAPNARVAIWTQLGRRVSLKLPADRHNEISSGVLLKKIGLRGIDGLLPLLQYRVGAGAGRWIELQDADQDVEDQVDGLRTLDDDVLDILGVKRRQNDPGREKGVEGEPSGDDGDDDDNGIGFTEHDGAMLFFFRRWRGIFRRLINLKSTCPDVYEAYILDIVGRITRQKILGSGELAFFLDCLTREELVPQESAGRALLGGLCQRLESSSPRLADLGRLWRKGLEG